MGFELIDALLGFSIRADDRTALKGVKHLGGMKAEHRQVAMAQDAAARVLHAKGVGSVVNDFEVVVVGNFLNGLHITRIAIAMHGHDGRGLRGDGSLDFCRVKVKRARVYVDEYGLNPIPQ